MQFFKIITIIRIHVVIEYQVGFSPLINDVITFKECLSDLEHGIPSQPYTHISGNSKI